MVELPERVPRKTDLLSIKRNFAIITEAQTVVVQRQQEIPWVREKASRIVIRRKSPFRMAVKAFHNSRLKVFVTDHRPRRIRNSLEINLNCKAEAGDGTCNQDENGMARPDWPIENLAMLCPHLPKVG